MTIVASPAERAALAQVNDLPAVHSFDAVLRAWRVRGEGIEVAGEVRARVRQICVATLEPFDAEIVEPVTMRFAPPVEPAAPRSRRGAAVETQEPTRDPLGEDPPDPLIGGVADVGAVAAEYFTLALDPYPRKPGAAFVEPGREEAPTTVSPFAPLRARTAKPGGKE